MIPFITTLALSFVSFLASAFVILRIVIPILPPHPLSRRVRPSEFGLPNFNFRSLTSADKSHLWLAVLDLLALGAFVWQAVSEYSGGATSFSEANDPASSARLWFALTIRQSCLLVVSGLTLIHIRKGRSVSFGAKHWMIWTPTLVLGLTSTALSAILAGADVPSLFAGLIAYSITTAVLSSAAFGGLVYTIVMIKRNLCALNEPTDSWPPMKEIEEPPRPSFATDDIDALREGSSWLTSDAGSSRHETMSNWSFSTLHTCRGSMRFNPASSQPSLFSKSSYWFNPPISANDSPIPPVPPLPLPYRNHPAATPVMAEDPDPFRRDAPSRARVCSQSSWLTSPVGTQASTPVWSYPGTPTSRSTADLNVELLSQAASSRPATPALSSAKVLGGYGHTTDSEKGIASLAVSGSEVDISYSKYVFWLLAIWVPLALSLPYLVSVTTGSASGGPTSVLLVLSVTLSSPLLAVNIIIRSPIPIPTALFGVHSDPPSVVMRAPSPADTLSTCCREYKRSGSVTVVEGRRSGDVWISQGDAVDGRGKIGRAIGLMSSVPKLSVLPSEEEKEDGELTPPLPIQEESTYSGSMFPTPQSKNSVEMGRRRKESMASSHLSGGEETFASRIMIAQRHYSAVATTLVVPASPDRVETNGNFLSVSTGIAVEPVTTPVVSSHLRSRSVSSMTGQVVSALDISRPPSQPLPPTPPNVRNAKQLVHRKSYSSGFFGALGSEDINEIDALTAGVLPLLVPGLKVGEGMKIRDWDSEFNPPLSSTVTKKMPSRPAKENHEFEFGVLPHSTPVQGRNNPKGRNASHRRKHLSLPSLGLDEDAVHTWKKELNIALDTKIGQYATAPSSDAGRRNTVWGDESIPNVIGHPPVTATECEALLPALATGASLGRSMSVRNNLGLRLEIPNGMASTRTSIATLLPPPSAASTATLFEPECTFEPLAQSTPHDAQKKGYPYARKYQTEAMAQAVPGSRRSSIVYLKSEGNEQPAKSKDVDVFPTTTTTTLAPASSSSQVVKPKEMKLKRKSSQVALRQLSLLRDRDTNKDGDKPSETRPLLLAKKSKVKVTRDENSNPSSGNKNLNLKPLQLGRSDSSKLRGILRKDEVLPSVVIRPPTLRVPLNIST